MNDAGTERVLKENAQLRAENQLLHQKVDHLLRQLFGSKSEKLDPAQLQLLLDGMGEPELPEASVDAAETGAKSKRSRRRKPPQPRYPEDLPLVEEVIDPNEVVNDPSAWRQIGQEISEQLDYEPGRFLRRRLIRRTWVRRDQVDAIPLTAALPDKLLERGILAPGLLAHVVISKYADHLPLYRQQQIFKQRHQVHLPRQTLARGVGLVAFWFKLVADAILEEQIAGGYIQVDETPVKYLSPGQGKCPQGYFWAVHVPRGSTSYHWKKSRGHENLIDFLEGFEGRLQCDGYGAYRTFRDKRENIELVACWAHARRKFHAAFEQGEAAARSRWILHQISLLYQIEKELREARAGPRLRAVVRAAQSRPILTRLRRLFESLRDQHAHRPQSLMGKALHYALNLGGQLEAYVEDGRVEIDNNLVENAIRPAALGRKNWMFIGSEGAGWHSAVIYTIIQSCRDHGLEPYAYIRDMLERLPRITNHQIPAYTPKALSEQKRRERHLVS